MKKRVILLLMILFLFSCGKTEEKENKFLMGIESLEKKDYVQAEQYFLQTDKKVNKEVFAYLLRLYEVSGNEEKAKEVFKAIGEEKDLIFEISYEYLFGSDYLKKDPIKAKKLLDALGKEKDTMSYLLMGYIYENGEGVDVSTKKAKSYYEKSGLNKELKNTLGKNFLNYILGLRYELGLGVEKDMNLAKESYKKAMEEDNRDAYTRLGFIQIKENKTERHVKNGFSYLEKALNMGDKNALLDLGEIYLKGITVPRDMNKAKEYYQKGMELNIKEAYGLLSHIELFNSESIVIDYKSIKEIVTKGSKLNDGNSSKILGYLYQNALGVKKNERLAEKYYLKAIDEGELVDNLVYWYLGNLYFYGSKRVQNNEKALTNYLISSQYNAASAYEVGLIYENGYGVDIDLDKAKEYYLKAKELVPKAEERYNYLNNLKDLPAETIGSEDENKK